MGKVKEIAFIGAVALLAVMIASRVPAIGRIVFNQQ